MTTRLRLASAVVLVAGVLLAFAPVIEANTAQPPFHMGRVWANPEFDGCGGWSASAIQVPGGIIQPTTWPSDNAIKRGWVGHARKFGNYLISTNWTDPDGTVNPVATSYLYRSYNYDAYAVQNWIAGSGGADGVNLNYLYPVGITLKMRNERPNIYVNGNVIDFSNGPWDPEAEYEIRNDGGTFPYPPPVIEPDLVVEYAIDSKWRYLQGIEVVRTNYAYPFGSAHQDYFIQDFTLTNNGISGANEPDDTADPAPLLDGQTVTNMIFVWGYGYSNAVTGNNALTYWDNYAQYTDPWGSGNYAFYWSDGNGKELVPDVAPYTGDDWGDYPTGAEWEGHPHGNAHIMVGTLFASESGAAPTTSLVGQPAFRLIGAERGLDYAGKAYSPTTAAEMLEFVASGDFQMADDTDLRDDSWSGQWVNPTTGDGATGPTMLAGHGPLNGDLVFDNVDKHGWNLAFGESVRIVQVYGGGSIDRNAAQEIGANWTEKANAEADPATWYREGDVELLASAEDTVRKAANMAWWNFYGEFPPAADAAALASWGVSDYATAKPAGKGEWDVPEAPRAPANVSYRSRAEADGGGIEIRWSKESLEPDFDTGNWDFSHYKIIRQAGSRLAPWVVLADNLTTGMLATAAADANVPFEGFIWLDKDVTAGTDYWYAVVAVDDGSQNWAEPGVALESTVWWTWSGYTEVGVTATQVGTAVSNQPAKFALNQNAPNPFNPETSISFSLPEAGQASLVIYGPTGQVVRTLINSTVEAGQHSVTWDGLDNFGRPVASGVYIYRLVSGDQIAHKRMVLVR